MGAGFAMGVLNQVLSCFLFKSKIKLFIKDIINGVVFSVIIFSFVVSFANYKVLRWYNVLAALVGFILFSPQFSKLVQRLFTTIKKFADKQRKKLFMALKTTINKKKAKISEQLQKKQVKSDKNVLQTTDKVMYNL